MTIFYSRDPLTCKINVFRLLSSSDCHLINPHKIESKKNNSRFEQLLQWILLLQLYISNFMLELTILHFEIYIAQTDLGSVEVLLEDRPSFHKYKNPN